MKKVIIMSAVWCPSCLILKKYLKKIREEYSGLEIETFDYDMDEDKVIEYKIGDKLPVIISFNNDIETGRLIGEKNYEEIVSFLKDSDII